jgi:hypothetical protein
MGAKMVGFAKSATFASLAILTSCSGLDECQDKVLDITPNPRKTMSAVTFSRNCGATTGENIQVAIVKYGLKEDEDGTVMIIDLAPEYTDIYKPIWTKDEEIILSIPAGSRVFLKKNKADRVNIKFKEFH